MDIKNSKRQYRLIERKNLFNKDRRYFPQVKMKKFPGVNVWRKIGKHNYGFGLYPINDYHYPKTKAEAEQICKEFDKWVEIENNTVNVIHTIKF